jgi:hypothetical protein
MHFGFVFDNKCRVNFIDLENIAFTPKVPTAQRTLRPHYDNESVAALY